MGIIKPIIMRIGTIIVTGEKEAAQKTMDSVRNEHNRKNTPNKA